MSKLAREFRLSCASARAGCGRALRVREQAAGARVCRRWLPGVSVEQARSCALHVPTTRPPFAHASRYTVIVSTFKPGHTGPFKLIVGHSACTPVVKPVAELGAGMASQVLKGRWSEADGTAAGCSNYHCYSANPTFAVAVARACSMIIRLRVRASGCADRVAHAVLRCVCLGQPPLPVCS